MSEITTTARRIARHLNHLVPHYRVAFDADGRPLGHSYGQNVDHSHLGDVEGCDTIWLSRPDAFGHRWNQRSVQDSLDEMPAANDETFQAALDAATDEAIADLTARIDAHHAFR